MTSRDFCYWLQGFFEIAKRGNEEAALYLNPSQADLIERHLRLVFQHEIDPSFGTPAEVQALQYTHGGGAPPAPDEMEELRRRLAELEARPLNRESERIMC